jgi:hypothetical protein
MERVIGGVEDVRDEQSRLMSTAEPHSCDDNNHALARDLCSLETRRTRDLYGTPQNIHRYELQSITLNFAASMTLEVATKYMSLGDTVSPGVTILVNTPKDLKFPSGRILDANATDANVTVLWFHCH